jgi:hypothetical protein
VQVGRVHVGEQHETRGIDQDVPLAAGGALGGVVATRWATNARGPHRLTSLSRRLWSSVHVTLTSFTSS